MYKSVLFVLFTFLMFNGYSQSRKERNLSKRKTFYYDPGVRKMIESHGYYYSDDLGETTERHGKWSFFNREGSLVEVRHYDRNKLHGEVKTFYGNDSLRSIGYFHQDLQDSIYIEFSLMGDTSQVGYFNMGNPTGEWRYFYTDGALKMVEEIIDSTSYVWEFYGADSAHTQTIEEGNGAMATYFGNGRLESWYNYKDGIKHGEFEEASVRGYYLMKGAFKENKPEGKWEYYYYTGDLEKITHYKDGKLNGEYDYYYDNGQLNVEGQFEDGEKTGEWTWYTNSGVVDMQGKFKDGLQHGVWKYNYPNGELSYRAKFKEGLKEGKWTYYYKNGKKFKVGHFENDLKNGSWTTWYEDGTLLMEGDYIDDLEEGTWKNYWENGQLKNQSDFTNGKLNGEWLSFYSSGKPLSKGSYDHGQKTGEWLSYFDNGALKDVENFKVIEKKSKVKYGPMKDRKVRTSVLHGKTVSYSQKDYAKTQEGKYKNGEKHGKWIVYHKGGVLPAVISHYKNGELHGKMQTFEFRGNRIISEAEYKNGVKHGKVKIFDENGKVIKEQKFENGIQIIEGSSSGTSFSPGR
ncbi:toxin-antitoxin system YwqK family antitoxin [Brumimicrobium aurantiacum]|uniref:Toxin-antitoxin system YwqK family antitoxin n=1 Tax=Brumimicrobium aurantiacum TaxID=1737063 RepID=A0A3E1F2A4_9FLAO|nr:toxin-antitoxin system YwqK family antitoxin [Brumimicrobium aurantiacum]RFC55945.1 hypothetical protein DXU93_03130 [Brumimicrobium aurantiacum]